MPKYDLDKAVASDVARSIINRVLHLGYKIDYQSEGLAEELRRVSRVQTVAEADREYVDYLLGTPQQAKRNAETEAYREACREARDREAAEKETSR